MSRWRLALLVASFAVCAGFSTDNAGRACVQQKGERGVGYDIYRTKVKDAYSPGGRRMVENGNRVYEIEVPALIKRDKPISCTMSLAQGQWSAPRVGSLDRSPITEGLGTLSSQDQQRTPEQNPFPSREMRSSDW